MTFEATEESRKRGSPINLFLFTYGPGGGDYHAFTDAETTKTYLTKDYLPRPIQRGAMKSSGSLDKATLEVTVDRDNPVWELFRVYPPSYVVSVIIFEGHTLDLAGEYEVVWNGRIINAQLKSDNTVTLTCELVATSMRRPGLRRPYQYMCPHYLYGPQCRADKEAATVAATVASVSGTIVTLNGGWETDERRTLYVGGMMEWDNDGRTEIRTILSVSANALTLSGIPTGLVATAAVDVIRGCDHLMTGCNLHDNINNFGGQPWIPTKNPLANTNNFG